MTKRLTFSLSPLIKPCVHHITSYQPATLQSRRKRHYDCYFVDLETESQQEKSYTFASGEVEVEGGSEGSSSRSSHFQSNFLFIHIP